MVSGFGLLNPSYRPAIDIYGVGNRVSGSILDDGRHSAIILSGNDHRIADNEIRRVVTQSDDAGAIYMGRDWTMRGNVISRNHIHTVGQVEKATSFVSGIYLDDQFSGTHVIDNVIASGEYGVVIGGGRDVLVRGNIFAGQRLAGVYADERGLTTHAALKGDLTEKASRDADIFTCLARTISRSGTNARR